MVVVALFSSQSHRSGWLLSRLSKSRQGFFRVDLDRLMSARESFRVAGGTMTLYTKKNASDLSPELYEYSDWSRSGSSKQGGPDGFLNSDIA